jgi:hypothetical protein
VPAAAAAAPGPLAAAWVGRAAAAVPAVGPCRLLAGAAATCWPPATVPAGQQSTCGRLCSELLAQ